MIYVCLKDPGELAGRMMPQVSIETTVALLAIFSCTRLVSNDVTQLIVKGKV
jgi:phage portal protein BeeE